MLAFDGNPMWAIPVRDALSRWVGPMRLFVFGRKEDRADAQAALRALARPTGLKLRLVLEQDVARDPPNAFIVADENLPAAFRGPLRGMLRNAFLGDEETVNEFIVTVIDRTLCWALPVWGDAGRTVLKAAVIGIDITQPTPEASACALHGLGAALGLMGPGAFLPASAFAPGTATRLSREDDRMLRVLYSRALHPGMRREEVLSAAQKALAFRPVAKKPQ